MKKKTITISIPEPCHENWDQMTPTEKGRFCGVCTKEVVDFSKSSDEELIKKVGNGENLCGRFKTSQLDRKLTLQRKSKNNFLPYAASLLVPLSLLGATDAIAQGGPRWNESSYTSLGIGSHPIKSIVTITGFVTDENNIPISNAEVFVLETGHSVRTKPDGSYRLVCTSGSTIFSVKGAKNSKHIVLGTKNAKIDFKLKEIITTKTVSVTVGRIASVSTENTVTDAMDNNRKNLEVETIEGEIEVEELPQVVNETNQHNTVLEALNNRMPVCGLDTADKKTEMLQQRKTDSVGVVIRGTITDENNLPLPGATIIVKGTLTGTQSNFDGYYEITSPPNSTLECSYLGYITQEVAVSTISNTIGIQMEASMEGNVSVIAGGLYISEDSSDPTDINNPFQYEFPRNDHERNERLEKRRKAKANEVAFQKIKLAKRKAAKQLKRKRK